MLLLLKLLKRWRVKLKYTFRNRSDYGSAETFSSILDVVNVMQFALSEGKVAVHCHAGLGRTGLLIACYFIYAHGMAAGEAINFVREKRPKSVQTTLQVNFAVQFEQFLKPYRVVFSNSLVASFTFGQFMHRQRQILHGYEGRTLKNIPKIIHSICERLLALLGKKAILTLSSAGDSQVSSGKAPDQDPADAANGKVPSADTCSAVLSVEAVCSALLLTYGGLKSSHAAAAATDGNAFRLKCETYMRDLSLDGRSPAWNTLTTEEVDPIVLATLFWQWLSHLREPIVTTQDANVLVTEMRADDDADDVDDLENEPSFNTNVLLSKLKRDVAKTLRYISTMVQRLQPIPEGTKRSLIQRLACAFTHTQEYYEPLGPDIGATSFGQTGSPCHVPRMSSAESECLLRFFYALINAKSDGEQSEREIVADASSDAIL